MGQLVDELKNQNQGPLPNDNEKSKCVGNDKRDVEKELEICEAYFEHMSKSSLFPIVKRCLKMLKFLT